MQIGRLTVSNTEIIIPKFTFGKDTCILWEQVQYIKKSKGVSIWYKSNGRTKVKPVGELHKKDLQKLVGFWNSHLTEQVKQNGCLTGTLINDLSSFVMIAVSIVFCSLALLFVYLILKNDTLNPISCLMIYYILLFLLLPAIIIAYAWLSEYKKVKKWHSWKIDKTGFYRLTNYNHLIKTEIQKGDTVTYDTIILNKNSIPWQQFSNNQIIPHLLSILAENNNIEINKNCANYRFKIGARLILFWPVFILFIWYLLPIIIFDVPPDFDFDLKIIIIVISIFFLFGIAIFFDFFICKIKHENNLKSFSEESANIKNKIHW